MTTSGRLVIGAQASPITPKAAKPQTAAIARLVLSRERIFDALSLQLQHTLDPAPVAVMKHAAGVVRRDHVMAAGSNGALRGVDLLVGELLRDQPDLSAVLDVDQSVLAH